MNLWNIIIVLVCRATSSLLKLLALGSGSTWPGHIALKLNPHFLKQITAKSGLKIVFIAGTNGKTTTSTLLTYFLEKNGKKCLQNAEGANLLNGIASSLLNNVSLSGAFLAEYAVFEIDENSLPLVLDQITPLSVIVLNLFRDQLDRYGEVNTIARNWHESFKKLPSSVHLVLNGDDPQIFYLGTETAAKVHYFGLDDELLEEKEIPHDVDSIYCPQCGEKLQYIKMSYSHLGDFRCTNCGFKRMNVKSFTKHEMESALKGLYNYYNISAVFMTLKDVLEVQMDNRAELLKAFKPAFGRQELIQYKNRKVFLLLSKNPTGFNQSIAAIQSEGVKNQSVMLILNDRIPDGRDVSWIWDVEFQNLLSSSTIVLSGDRTFDLALRFKYCFEEDVEIKQSAVEFSFKTISAIPQLETALEKAISVTPENDTLYILATYSGMLDVRKLLVGKKLL